MVLRSVYFGIAVLAACAALSGFLLLNFHKPYPVIFFILSVAATFFAVIIRRKGPRIVCLNAAILLLAATAVEGGLWLSKTLGDRGNQGHIYPSGYIVSDPILGYAPQKKATISTTKKYKGETVYSADYAINDRGLRVGPPHSNGSEDCILFFGCSKTFGEGVNDDQAMPYQVGLKTGGKYQIHNFGFHGYGPHQMLAAVEHGIVDKVVDCNVRLVVYQAILGHIRRSAGLTDWDTNGPRYILEDNQAVYAGSFSGNLVFAYVVRALNKSLIVKRLRRRTPSDNEAELFLEIVAQSKNLLKEKFPNAGFHVLLWGSKEHRHFKLVVDGMNDRGLDLHLISDIEKMSQMKSADLIIHKYDQHPNASAHELIADYVVTKIVEPVSDGPPVDHESD